MMFSRSGKSLLLISFDPILSQRCMKELSPFCDIDYCTSMELLESSNSNPGAIIYLMDFTRADHLYNLNYIRNKYPNKHFFVISATLSIPLLHQSLHIGVNDLFIFPLSNEDKFALFCAIKNETSVECLQGIENKVDFISTKNSINGALNSVLELIERDYCKSPSLMDLSKEVCLSPSRISHLFKDFCGLPYSHYLLFRKIEEGERLLDMGKSSITSISYQIGFANPSHFCRSFKEHFCITPASYASGCRDIKQSDAYIKYQRIRSELLPELAMESNQSTAGLEGMRHVI